MLSPKEVMVLFITGMEMKGDLKEFTEVGSKSHEWEVESSDAGGKDSRQVSASFHLSPFIKDGLGAGKMER